MSLPLLCVPGPTGAGKTGAGIALAQALNGEVINFDSRQIYQDFPIITAQPSAQEQAQCPHLLYGFLPTADTMTATVYAKMALETIEAVVARGRLPILVGGTGMYLRWLLTPMAPIPDIPEDVRARVREAGEVRGANALHEDLVKVDPVLAQRLHPNDKQRIMRGLEVFEATGKPLSQWQDMTPEPRDFRVLKMGVGIALDELTPRLYQRIDLMVEAGAVLEAQTAMENNADPAAPGWTGIGCAELLAFLRQEIGFDECLKLWGHNTRAYAKRQWTWFKADSQIRWYNPGEHEAMVLAARAFLAG